MSTSPDRPSARFENCATCGEPAWSQVPDGRGGTIYAYNCLAEIVMAADGRVTIVRRCVDFERRTQKV